ncbi:MAG: hypothetical protein K8R59_17805 [Thermoanaerobaculales bacterium]|nr:hypothetical protein [Thermoanaerobaculales bacterium]
MSYFDESGRVRVFRAAGDSFTVGSDDGCDLRIPGLEATACRIYLAEDGYYAFDLGGRLEIEGRPGSGYLQNHDTLTLSDRLSLRFGLEPKKGPEPAPRHETRAPLKAQSGVRRAPGAKRHRPGAALVLGLILPGSGQAYNGQPFKGVFFLLTFGLVLPWIWSLFDARSVANGIATAGGRTGRGGPLWFFLHGWFAINLVLLPAIVLTLAGVLS